MIKKGISHGVVDIEVDARLSVIESHKISHPVEKTLEKPLKTSMMLSFRWNRQDIETDEKFGVSRKNIHSFFSHKKREPTLLMLTPFNPL